jgi:hypothetical protein
VNEAWKNGRLGRWLSLERPAWPRFSMSHNLAPRISRPLRQETDHYDPSVLLTVLNVPLMLVASLLTIPTIATTIRPSITAYSTAVGPSSLTKKR